MNFIIDSENLLKGLCSTGTTVNNKEYDSNIVNGQAPTNDMCDEHYNTTKTCNQTSSTAADTKTKNSSSMTDAERTEDVNITEQGNKYCSSSYGVLLEQMNDIRGILGILVKAINNNYNSQRTDDSPTEQLACKKDELPTDIITQAEAAKMLGVKDRTIRNYVSKGYIRRKSIGKKPYYSRKEIIEYMNRRK